MRNLLSAVLVLAVAAFALPLSVHASAPPDAEYAGVTTDLADFKFTVAGAITTLEIGTPTASVPFPCFTSGQITLADPIEILNNVIRRTASEREIMDPSTGQLRRLRLSGWVNGAGAPEEGIARGSVSISAVGPDVEGVVCNPRSFGWIAVAPTQPGMPLAQSRYEGRITAGQSVEGLREDGTASFLVSADATAVTRLTLATTQECSATDLRDSTAALTNGVASLAEDGRASTAIPTVGKYRLAVGAMRAVGAFYIDREKVGCLALSGFFVATPTAATTSTPTVPAASAPALAPSVSSAPGTITSGAIPPSGGIGLIVWGGGASEALAATAGCPTASAVFWVANVDGVFDTYVPGASNAAVNASWTARFVSGIPAGTPLLGRCI